MKRENLIGMKFGRLTVIDYAADHIQKSGKHRTQWLCRCECGNTVIAQSFNLKSGNTKSCGCYANEVRVQGNIIHGDRHTRLYTIWSAIKNRCYNRQAPTYYRWGGRGIKMCDEWRDSYLRFKTWALNNGYSEDLSIDRIDNNLGYNPDNCRWATAKIQANNRSNSKLFCYSGNMYTISELSDMSGISYHTLFARINKLHWSVEKAISTPVRNQS